MKNIWTIIGTVVVVLLVVFLCIGSFSMLRFARLGGGGAPGMMGRFDGYGMMGGINPFGWIMPLAVLAVIVIGIVLFIVWFVNQNSNQAATATPVAASTETLLDVLKMRYAKGEITKEQFEEAITTLGLKNQ